MTQAAAPTTGDDALVAVLTGDFIGSTKHPPETLDRAFGILGNACRTLTDWHGADLRLTRFRGDGWQVVLARPCLALRSALFIQSNLLSEEAAIATRIAAGIGDLSRPGSGSLADADGTALHEAGRALDDLGRRHRLGVAGGTVTRGEKAAFVLADAISRRWTAAQAEALIGALTPDGPTQAEIAVQLDITQQSVSDRLDASSFWAVRDALSFLEINRT